jgi:hypothetical protein
MAPNDVTGEDALSRIAGLLGVRPGFRTSLETLQRHTRQQLLEWCDWLGLTGLSRLTKEGVARRLQEALHALGVGEEARDDAAEREPPDVARKFDLGRRPGAEAAPRHIPWSYGQDRVTAMMVDPDRLYVYWEVTDEAIARARAGLGSGGPDAWLDLRVYDVTGRLFDGTNAHRYFDHRVERDDRQWFFHLAAPGSTAVVELGLRSFEGYFVRMARSGRVDFPRTEPAPPGDVEWLTVRDAVVEPGGPGGSHGPAPGDPAPIAGDPGPDRSPAADHGTLPRPDATAALWALLHERGEGIVPGERVVPGEAFEERWEWQAGGFQSEWHDGERTLEWRGPVLRTSWEAGPFEVPVESPAFVEDRHGGPVRVLVQDGRTRVVYGPWQVTIRGLDGRLERRVVATWELECSWATVAGVATVVGAGGSERGRRGASELRLGAASEVWRLGASELRFLGASERLRAGASEQRLRGASEQRLGGASERSYAGASEHRLAGGSEHRLADDGPLAYPGAGTRG